MIAVAGRRRRSGVAAVAGLALLAGCDSWLSSRHAATFKLGEDLSLKLSMTRNGDDPPRFTRTAWLERADTGRTPQVLSVDAAEHATTSLYRCDRDTLMLVSDHDRWSVDTRSGAITNGACAEPAPLYLGAYDWDSGQVWRYFHARDRLDRFAPKDPLDGE